MKIKNLKINEEAASLLLSAAMLMGSITGCILYYQHKNQEQVCEINLENNIYNDEYGKTYCCFEAGEHIITISRNDAYYHKSEIVEGYTIKEVEINGWRDNNKITYVNTVPVIVEATKDKDGKLTFNNFGMIISENNYTKKYK